MDMNDMTPFSPAHPAELPRAAVALNDGEGSLISMLPPKVQELCLLAMELRPELFEKTEQELFKYLSADNTRPDAADNRLRLKFWMEYDRARLRGEARMNIDNVVAGVCYKEYFYAHYLTKPPKLAWMLSMPVGYATKINETLEYGIDQLREVLAMDHMVNGKPVPTILNLKKSIVDMLHSWVKGAPVQRTLAVNVNASRNVESIATHLSVQELEKKHKELVRRNREARNLPGTPEGLEDEE